jgi:hypothetical protein
MSDLENQEANDAAVMDAMVLESLKLKANTLGVKFHPSISAEKLSEKIKEHIAALDAGSDVAKTAEDAPLSQAGKIKKMRDEALALVRVNVVCMNPAKREWNGEIITVGNRNLPTQKKFVPFNTPEGYHLPKIMYDMLVARECPVFYNERVKSAMGIQNVRRMKRIPEFNIQVLPPLTPAELKELARQQAAAAGME